MINHIDIVGLYYAHIRTYPGDNPETGEPWTKVARIDAIVSDMREARAMMDMAGDVLTMPGEPERTAAMSALGLDAGQGGAS